MERHIGLWKAEEDDNPAIAELIIEGNHLEFYRRDSGEVFPSVFIGSDNDYSYKVFTNGTCEYGKHRSLSSVSSYETVYVLKQKCQFSKGMDINGATACSFIIPELIDWIDINTVKWSATKNKGIIASEIKLPEIILKAENPRIEIYFESKNSLFDAGVDVRTTFMLRNQPRIRVIYEEASDVSKIHNDIRGIMQFFALLIGHVTDALDIRLDFLSQKMDSWLYINTDLSYNLRTQTIIDRPRTKLEKLHENIQSYFEKWYEFYYDDKFELIRRMYFLANIRKDIYVEDILIQYVRILEGYHLRVTEDEQISTNLNDEIKLIEKDIKKLIFTDEGKALFTSALEKANISWNFNSEHAGKVASWIAAGYLEKTNLARRIELLNNQYFNIIAKNAINIIKLEKHSLELKKDKAHQTVIREFYEKIVATRNYYSHYKAKKEKVMNITQINNTNKVLKALIIMILFSHMGMDKEQIRKIVIWDTELSFQTMHLRKEGETPDNT